MRSHGNLKMRRSTRLGPVGFARRAPARIAEAIRNEQLLDLLSSPVVDLDKVNCLLRRNPAVSAWLESLGAGACSCHSDLLVVEIGIQPLLRMLSAFAGSLTANA